MAEKRLVFPSATKKEVVAQEVEKSPPTSFFFKCGKPNLILTYDAQLGKKIFFQNYSFVTNDTTLADVIRKELVARNLAVELTEETFVPGPMKGE